MSVGDLSLSAAGEPIGRGAAAFEEEVLDALSAINVSLMRLYDAQMSLLQVSNPEFARYVSDTHDRGQLLGSPPVIGDNPFEMFMAEQQNSPVQAPEQPSDSPN